MTNCSNYNQTKKIDSHLNINGIHGRSKNERMLSISEVITSANKHLSLLTFLRIVCSYVLSGLETHWSPSVKPRKRAVTAAANNKV